jgi:hypothetical protein
MPDRAGAVRGAAAAQIQILARRWQELLNESTVGDSRIRQAMKRLCEEQGDARAAQFGSENDSRPNWDYISRAIAAGKRLP